MIINYLAKDSKAPPGYLVLNVLIYISFFLGVP